MPAKHQKVEGGRFAFSRNREHRGRHAMPETGNGRTGSNPKVQVEFKPGDAPKKGS
jgi:hypothetical protein